MRRGAYAGQPPRSAGCPARPFGTVRTYHRMGRSMARLRPRQSGGCMMDNRFAMINIDTEFRVAPDCRREGEVECRVIRAECAVVDQWDCWVTIRLRLLLRITVHSGHGCQTFCKELTQRETVWVDDRVWVRGCEVEAAVCKCVLHRGRIHCNLTVKVGFHLRSGCGPQGGPHCGCGCGSHRGSHCGCGGQCGCGCGCQHERSGCGCGVADTPWPWQGRQEPCRVDLIRCEADPCQTIRFG